MMIITAVPSRLSHFPTRSRSASTSCSVPALYKTSSSQLSLEDHACLVLLPQFLQSSPPRLLNFLSIFFTNLQEAAQQSGDGLV
jgi:hypothetical protein